MRRLALITLAFGLASGVAWAEQTVTFEGHEIAVLSTLRAKEFRDLKVKDAKKHDLAIVALEVRWKGERRHILLKDDDLAVRDASGKNHECMLKFVQADAQEEEGPARIEIPFQVAADAALVGLRIGRTSLAIDSPASSPKK